jgi:hypothetical protein
MQITPGIRRWAFVLVVTAFVTSCTVGVTGGDAAAAASPASASARSAKAPRAAIPEPADDPFYQPPGGYETTAPGTILRTRSVTVTGLAVPVPVKATQMLVRSSDAHGRPAAVVSTLMVPQAQRTGPRPLLAYQPATDSLGDQCNPSYTLRTGREKELPLIAMGLSNGWAVVVTDYEGPRSAFGAGRMAGHATLDGIRAAEQLPSTGLAGTATPVGLWGYSGGALATGWAAELQPSYAPELHLSGVAAGGTPADLEAAGRGADGGPFSGLVLAVSVGLSREYPELLAILNDAGRRMADDIGDMCLEQETSSYPFRRLNEFTVPRDPLSHPTAQAVLDDNHLGSSTPTAPVYLYHAVFDQLVPHRSAQALRSAWCRGGAAVRMHSDLFSEHISLAVTGAPAAVAYLKARFQGSPAPSNCPA